MNKPFKAILVISLMLNLLLAILFILELAPGSMPDSGEEFYSIDLTTPSDSLELVGGGIISTRFGERDFSLSTERNELFFTQSNFDHSVRAIMTSSYSDTGWSIPAIAHFSGRYNDIEPFLAPDGLRLFFASDRPLHSTDSSTDYNLWYTVRQEDIWAEPIPLPGTINSDGDEFFPAVARNGNLYFTATLPNGIGSEDIFMSEFKEGVYRTPIPLDSSINSSTYEFNAYISPDENLIFFSSFGREDDLGGGDLYMSERDENGYWMPARHLKMPINSSRLDYCPFYEVSTKTLFFTSNRKNHRKEEYLHRAELLEEFDQISNGMDNIYKIKLSRDLID